MKLVYTELNDLERMKRLLREHPDWHWMDWENAWERNRDEDYWAVAMSLMMEGT